MLNHVTYIRFMCLISYFLDLFFTIFISVLLKKKKKNHEHKKKSTLE